MNPANRLKRKAQFADESDSWAIRVAKPRVAPKAKLGSGLNKAVMKLINKTREVKHASYSSASNLNAYTGTGWSSVGVVALSPYTGFISIVQGTGQGDRIGNKIEIVSAKMTFQFAPNPYNATTNPSPEPQNILGWVVNVKQSTAQPTSLATFFQAGDSVAAAQGTILDATRPINTDQYQLYRRFQKKVGWAVNTGTGSAAGYAYLANNDHNLSERVSMDVTKYLPKIVDYNDTTSTPTSKAIWLFMETVNSIGSAQPAATLPTALQYTIEISFRDA